MKNFIDQLTSFSSLDPWIQQLIFVLISAILVNIVVNYFLHYAEKASKLTIKIWWDDALVNASKAPLIVLVWVLAAKFSAEVLIKEFHDDGFIAVANPVSKIAIITCFAWFFLRLVNQITQAFIKKSTDSDNNFDHTTIDALSKLARIIVFVFASLVIVQNLGFSISGILAAGGAGGLVIGFAAKDLFANLIGGLTIYLDRPFSVGDWIRCDDKIEGTVEYIGWRHTRLRAFNKNPIYVPNSTFTTVVVENPSRMTHRRLKEIVGIRYCDISKLDKITAEVKKMLEEHSAIDQDQVKIVNFESFNASSVDFIIYVLTRITNWQEFYKIKQDILLKVAQIIEANQAEIAFPTRTIHITKE